MAPKYIRVVVAVLILASISVAASWATPATPSQADSAAIKMLFDEFNNAFNNHDAHAVAMLFTDNADFITVQGAKSQGRAAIEEHLAPLFAGRLKTVHRDVTSPDILLLRPDVATIDSNYETTGIAGPNGTPAPATKGLYDWIVTKQNGHWLIAVWHESNLPVPQG